ncbi:phosphoribosylaminoimidazole carboxylase [Heterostelium album PN500]|uniref:Phosphoribosylaminoimidazole carboxylase n=1 Tax=Heterostelium pallidum (strain ATCC 26659 / Pp 5 / PN500) TaxID=670386 RepID=D3BCJ2_HETP5|nr:phosphoribosylaminoimidazole carboxylase [Heterostelium album PN500]EFA80634.1 phosphoribosylaminoimidazole carboxylase [Heterostelium album PN500]|eukprot:XP_020432754.1 phosphoribosylaminoimidazole carboxylase [Heterostelium album PN500]
MSSTHIPKAFDTTDVTFIASGKTKSIFKLNKEDQYVLILSNSSITAGDGAKKDELPMKGINSTSTTCNVFRVLQLAGINTHYIRQEQNNSFIAKRCSMIPLEVIVRRLATGSYLKRNQHITEGTRFNPCLIEFTFKDDVQHDPLVTEQDILEMNLNIGGLQVNSKVLSQIRHVANLAFEALERAWASIDVVLVDFKVEFGVTTDGEIILADVIDNDSWRIWPHGDKNQMKDKQVYRNIPLQSGAPTVGTLSDEQTKVLVDNYSWVANESAKLVDYMVTSNHSTSNTTTTTPSNQRHSNVINNILSPVPSYSSPLTRHINQSHQVGQPCLSMPPANGNSPMVGIIMGSQSDWETMKLAANTLTTLQIPFEAKIVSAHRTPDRMFEYARAAKSNGLKVIIAGAGGAAHLPGMVAALTSLPVFGVPVQSKALSGVDSLLSIVQMPAGIPVGTVAIGAAGATNAALLAAAVLAPFYPAIDANLEQYRKKQTDAVAETPSDNPAAAAHGHAISTPSSNDMVSHISTLLSVQPQSSSSSSSSSSSVSLTTSTSSSTVSTSQSSIKTVKPTIQTQSTTSSSPMQSLHSPLTGVNSPIRSTSPSIVVADKSPLSTFVLSTLRPSALVLPPGSTIGILGGGQLARMTAIAAAQLGYKTHVFCPENDASASHVATFTTKANYNNYSALELFASKVDVVTYEFENIQVEPVEYLSKKVAVFPDPKVLRICQDRVQEKKFIQSLGVGTANFEPVESLEMLQTAIQKIGYPSILKSNTMGYDGKGQVKITDPVDLESAWKKVCADTNTSKAILEQYIEFESEASVIVARGLDSIELPFSMVTNKHRNHILRQTIAPASLPEYVHKDAKEIASKIGKGIGLVGVLAVELFVVKRGDTYQLLVNELAPRPHNSGHWTIEGCVTSQFEQLVRCVCGLPLGSVDLMKRVTEKESLATDSPIIMNNLLGAEVDQWEKCLSQKGSHLHIYAKGDAREGRKMGHVTIIP